jgi:hypothetical protein
MISELGYAKRKRMQAVGLSGLAALLFALFIFAIMPAVAWADEKVGPEQVILTWNGDPAVTQAITWLSPDREADKLQYVKAADFSGEFTAARQADAVREQFAGSDKYRFTVTLIGLDPDTQYCYRVGRDGAWSENFSFSTSATPDDFAFLYLGDVQEGYLEWGNMVEEIYRENPEIRFALLGGDLTNHGEDVNEWGEFLSAAAGVFSQIPMMPAKGNHDGNLFLDFFALPENGPPGVIGSCFYSFDYGDAHFVVLDTSNVITDNVKQWLQQDLQNTNKKWKFAVFHHPPYQNFDDNKTIDDALREHWVPILEQNQVDMVFVGHQHVYMRTHPIFQGEVQSDSDGIVYVMGNSGSKHYALGQGFPYIAREETGSNYQLIEIKGDVLTLTSRKSSGELIEIYTVNQGDLPGEEDKPHYTVHPDAADPTYAAGSTEEGICTMTVNPGISGLKYFTVGIEPEITHEGKETVVFTHLRNGSLLHINATRADFDQIHVAQAGFNVQDGDVVKAFIVDNLTNDDDQNPVILQ